MAYEMPKVDLGDTIYWFPGGNDTIDPHVAFVTRIARDNINVNILAPNSYNFMIRDGVRHCDDKRSPTDLAESGGWLTRHDWRTRKAEREKAKQLQRQRQDDMAKQEATVGK